MIEIKIMNSNEAQNKAIPVKIFFIWSKRWQHKTATTTDAKWWK